MSGSKVKRLTKDMKENGFDPEHPVEYVTVDGRKVIVDGHHRTEAARKARIKEIPAIEKQVTPEQAEKLASDAAKPGKNVHQDKDEG
jgi:filamentous hemagglutinin